MDDVEKIIRQHLEEQFLQDKPDLEVTGDTNLIEQEVVDSLGIFLLVDFIQKRFGLEVGEEEVTLDNFETVRAITDLVTAKLPRSH